MKQQLRKLWLLALLAMMSVANAWADNEVAQIGSTKYATLSAAVEAATDGATIKIIKAGNYAIPAITKTLTIDAENVTGVVVEHTTNAAITTIAQGKTATFKNITFDLGTTVALATAHGFGTLNGNNGALVMDGCTINGALNLFGVSTFTNCTFSASGIYNIWAVNDNATFTDCTFENTNRAVNVYDQKHGTTSKEVSFSNCTFNSTGNEKKKAAINIHHNADPVQATGAKFAVSISNCSTSGDNWAGTVAETGEPAAATICYSPLWMISDIKNWADGDITVTVGGAAQNVIVAQIGEAYYATLADAVEAAAENDIVKILKAGTYAIPAITKTLTIDAENVTGVVVEHTTNAAITTIAQGKTATFKNITFDLGTTVALATAHGFGTLNGNNGALVMDGCTINGALNLFGVSTFTNCTFSASGIYNIWAVNDNATFTNCTFENTNRAVNVYDQKHGNTSKTVSFSGCTFNGSAKKKAAINIHHNPDNQTAGAKFAVTISNCTTSGDNWAATVAETGEPGGATICYSPLWMISDIKNWKNDDIKVTVGTDVQNFSVAQIGEAKYPTLQEAFNAGGEVTLLNDITLSEAANIPSGKEVTLNLNGKTIIGPTADYAIIVEGTLTVSGETDGSAINATSNTANKGVFFVKNGQLTINSGTFTAASDVAVITIDDENDASQIVVSGGTFSSNVNEFAKEGYIAIQEQEGNASVYKVYTMAVSTTSDTTTEHTETMTVKDGDTTKQTITVSVTPTASESTSAGDVALNQVDLSSVIQDVIAATDLGTDPTINVSVELQVNATTKSSDTTGDNKKITFEVKPQAVVKVNDTAKDPVDISNDQLTDGAKFDFTLDVTDLSVADGGQVKVVHKSSDSATYPDETFMATVTEEESKKYVNITTTHFSEFEVSNSSVSAGDDVTLTDGATTYNITTDTQVASATYVRSFDAERVDKYQSWLVPFDYTITAEDASNFDFFKINMIANAPDEATAADANKLWIFLDPVTTGATLHANMPYVFKPKSEQTNYQFKTTSATLKAKNAETLIQTQTMANNYNFYATYSNTTATAGDPFYYVSVDGKICKGTSVTVGAYRWIIKATSKSISYSPLLTFDFVEGDNTNANTTGIETLDTEKGCVESYYNISGQEMKTPGKGVHIVKSADGKVKKVIIK